MCPIYNGTLNSNYFFNLTKCSFIVHAAYTRKLLENLQYKHTIDNNNGTKILNYNGIVNSKMWPVFYIKDFIQILIYTVETKIVNILVVSEYTFKLCRPLFGNHISGATFISFIYILYI